ncbi:MAG: membrane protease subunit, stomatin/prohibitin [Ignavibacteria bacterium GWA2_55_11]|nr:MAG: membrane protease subunit, stomatin/prohibitin [Ignavibacteria bacterium GWA2_55_11]OGU68439.1 MAG: membrane protease subunit, stomatin/prohibitin [Ignavibacteria bacterium RIFCSPHIGHO2_02_FULL_56_12]OGU75748.1 MAG: membrane protease subunit, stomatin/prohibitin [Ignavibacteria bacterium RIFCSPLOWO2_02_FULL_55_14]OGU76842.1 MAG: membrane protease subunit, stomatin/prohibitin [Ignavibacteria bacterium RIFCSPLOWO2_12_FULL_56_21]HAV23692.1 membrane protease subunit, stomatin/prohibitin [Ba
MLFIVSVLIGVGAFLWYWNARRKFREEKNQVFQVASNVAGVVFLIFSVLALSRTVAIIPPGHVGVVVLFGSTSETTLKSGINTINPFADVIEFSVRTEELKEVMDVPSKEGLTVRLEVSVLYHLDPDMADDVYRQIGPTYVETILEPNFRSVTRGVTAGYDARALYTSEREQLAQSIMKDLENIVGPRGIEVESTPLRTVILPTGLTASIEEKLRAEQESQRMQFVLTKERQEADRKRIEAQGISDFQNIVARGISENLLRWKGIEATEKLAQSQNTKVIVIGAGKDGLPLILDTK